MAVCPGKIRLNGLVDIAQDGSWAEDAAAPPVLPDQGRHRWRCRCTRSSAPSRMSTTSRRAGRRALTCTRCSVRAWIRRSPATRRPRRELLAVLQLFRTTQKMIFRYEIEEGPLVLETEVNGQPWQMYNDTVIGFDGKGSEAVRLSVIEPFIERPAERMNSI